MRVNIEVEAAKSRYIIVFVCCQVFALEEGSTWKSLPYEVAAATVRTLVLHLKQFQTAKARYIEMLTEEGGESVQKKKKKCKDDLDALTNCERYIVMNTKTGQIATQEWVQKHIKCEGGQPVLKNEKAKIKPWVMSLTFQLAGQGDANIKLKPSQNKEAMRIRCLDLRTGVEQAKISFLLNGYGHIATSFTEEEDQDIVCSGPEEEDDDQDSMIGDEEGLPGQIHVSSLTNWHCIVGCCHRWTPASPLPC